MNLVYLICMIIITILIVDMSERCIHCGAEEGSIMQPEYANWVSG